MTLPRRRPQNLVAVYRDEKGHPTLEPVLYLYEIIKDPDRLQLRLFKTGRLVLSIALDAAVDWVLCR
ncbi:MAG: hypothetical protein ACHQC8_02635 [Solirubrobacterales bacterium]